MAKTKKKKELEKINLEPLGDRLIVRVDEAPKESKGGIILSQAETTKTLSGTVLAVGWDEATSESPVKRGTRVFFSVYAGTVFDPDDKGLLILAEGDLLAREVSL